MNLKTVLSFLLPGLVLLFLAAQALGRPASAQTPTPEPTATSTPGAVVITLNPSQRALSCSASTAVGVNMTVGGTAAPDGTQVTIATSLGTVAPAIVATAGGNGTFTYFSPSSGSGTATLTATAMGGTATTTISLFCGVGPSPQPPPGAVLGTPNVACFGAQANVTFPWTPVGGADSQFVDLSLANNGFAPGSFIGFGPLSPTTNQIQWNGLIAGQTHFWRVSAGIPGIGWAFSQTGSFTPCGSAVPPNQVTHSCVGGGRANVTWSLPQAPAGTVVSYLDITIFNNGFVPGTFIGAPVAGQNHTWPGILANTPHWWRVNDLTPSGWLQRSTGVFTPVC